MTLRRYSGTLRSSNASMILSHLAVLNALRPSKPIIAHTCFVHRLPLMAFSATDTTLSMASIVDRPFLKPNWLSDKPPTCCSCLQPDGYDTFKQFFGDIQHADGSSGGLFPLGRSTNPCIFHCAGNILSLRHALKVSLNI